MVEDVIVTLNSWEYPIEFFVLSLETNMGGYPLILGRPWLATADAYISCRFGKMTISNGMHIKNLTLYSPAQPLLQDDQVIWLDLGDDESKFNSIHQLMMIERDSFVAPQKDDDVISSIITNEYGVDSLLFSQQDFTLETILPPNAPQYSESSQFLHTLLPHEMHSPLVDQIAMMGKVIKIEVILGKELNISSALSPTHQESMLKPL